VLEGGARGRRWWSRPEELVEQTRRLFCGLGVLSALVLLPAVLRTAVPVTALLSCAVIAALSLLWVHRYLSRRTSRAADAAEVALIAAAVAVFDPSPIALGIAFPSVWFRSVYGTTRGVVQHCALLVLGTAVGAGLWGSVPGHDGPGDAGTVLGCAPLMLTTMAGARHLADVLFARERGQRRDAVLSELGRALLTTTDRAAILALGERAARGVSEVTPGLASALVEAAPDGARVRTSIGAWRGPLPAVLPDVVLPAEPPADGRPLPLSSAALDGAAGRPGRWVAVPDPTLEGNWLVSGALDRFAAEGVPAMVTAFTQVALALVNSEAHRALSEQARTDALTGLANRTAFTEALERAAAEPSARFSVAFVDLDDFKVVNDGRGHAAGDALLRAVAGRLRSVVREGDLCARLGGDEFAVLLREPDEPAVADLAERVVEVVVRPVDVPGGAVRVGASVGVAHRRPGEDAEQVVQHADVAMYAAKAAGKNRVRVFA
ncbi:diguanylate cyclase domain-containing protein, partial [Kineococcus indalonis]|uniref:diguanylate cyclase domain-containing protein n=1 Tax=Kineococcus indalonis TaxID=2696566 RepID=UPI0014130F87